jgi:exodeoxyribonuclease-5
MARGYGVRGIADFALALWEHWANGDAQVEGRPDAEADAVSIITIHSAKGLEWPIVIPINSTTSLKSDTRFLYRRLDDSVQFRVFDFPSYDYNRVAEDEMEAQRRERVRLWYVALTRARDLLLLPRQIERIPGDWLSIVTLDINSLPLLDLMGFEGSVVQSPVSNVNVQDLATWGREMTWIAASERRIVWHQPSRHEGQGVPAETSEEIFVGTEATVERLPTEDEEMTIRGGRERGLLLHKLLEEVLTKEISEDVAALQKRAIELLAQLGIQDAEDAATGPSSGEMVSAVRRALQLPVVAALRPRLLPEFRAYAGILADQQISLTAGIADAVATDEEGRVAAVIDWKSDVDPTPGQIEIYRGQVRNYLAATKAPVGFVIFLTSTRVERVELPS